MDSQSILLFMNDFRTIVLIVLCLLAYSARPFHDKRLNFLFAYLVLTVVSNVAALATRDGNNMYLSYFITPIHIVLYTFLLIPDKGSNKSRLIIFCLLGVGLVLNFYEAFLTDGGVNIFNSVSNTFNSILFGVLSLGALIRLRYDPKISNLAVEPMFWVFLGVAIESMGSIITTAFYGLIQGQDPKGLLITLVLVAISVDYIANVLYMIGFIKARGKKIGRKPKPAT